MKKNIIITPLIAIEKAKSLCAYQDRSQQEIREKLFEWKIEKDDIEGIIAKLITEGFINEERFSRAFAGGKFRIKKWGKTKIKNELQKRNISEYCIKKALLEIPEDDYIVTLKELILKKSKEIKESNTIKKKYKLAQYAVSRGFEQDLIWNVVNELY